MTKTLLPDNFTKHMSNNPLQKFLINNFYESLISIAKPLNAKNILDAGCGEGFTLNKFMLNKVGQSIKGIEYSKKAISLGKKLFPEVTIEEGSIYNMPYEDKLFDLVLCTEVLEHMEKPQKALLETIRTSKKNILLSVPNEPFFRLANFCVGKYIWDFGNSPGHINHWTIISFIRFLRKNKLKVKAIKFPFPWILILAEK